jgi:hypothetical protein
MIPERIVPVPHGRRVLGVSFVELLSRLPRPAAVMMALMKYAS